MVFGGTVGHRAFAHSVFVFVFVLLVALHFLHASLVALLVLHAFLMFVCVLQVGFYFF